MHEEMRILIVDDNQMMAKTLQDILKVKGFQAQAAYSGPEALTKLGSELYDCVLSDIKMPEINGLDLYRAIKIQQPDLPVVFMTAYAANKLIDEGLAEGVIGVLTKPLDIQKLLDFLAYLNQECSNVLADDAPVFSRALGNILLEQEFCAHQRTWFDGVM